MATHTSGTKSRARQEFGDTREDLEPQLTAATQVLARRLRRASRVGLLRWPMLRPWRESPKMVPRLC
jgi:hypothetical protein